MKKLFSHIAFDSAIFGVVGAIALIPIELLSHMFGFHARDFVIVLAPVAMGIYHAVFHRLNFCNKFWYDQEI